MRGREWEEGRRKGGERVVGGACVDAGWRVKVKVQRMVGADKVKAGR